jgi:hypothetical protein
MNYLNIGADEKVVVVVREHIIFPFMRLLLLAFLASIPFIAQTVFSRYVYGISDQALSSAWVVLRDLYLLFCSLLFVMILTFYHLDVAIVTTQRIIDIDQLGLRKHQTVELHINQIQDVSADITGLWATIFNYGNVDVQSSGDIAKVRLENIRKPQEVKRFILESHYAKQNQDNEPRI